MEYKIEVNSNINKKEIKDLIEAYHNACKIIYGNDLVDNFLQLTNLEKKDIKDTIMKEYSENYQRAINLLKNFKDYSLLTMRDKNNNIIAIVKIKCINNKVCSISEIAYVKLEYEEENKIFYKIIEYVIDYFTNLKYIKIYLEIPNKEGSKLFTAVNKFGFIEDTNINGLEKTYKLSKNLSKKGEDNQIIIVNKESGYTSREVVNKLNKILNNKKIGHTGTLDPIASGVLVCLTGKYTKLVDIITNVDKEYIAEIKLGIQTDTLDITGKITNESKVSKLNKKNIEEVLNSFVGKYIETIPKYSAVHVNGKRLYEYAHNNEEVELPKKEVNIKSIELKEYKNDIIKFKTSVSKGTYIRSLIQDICNKLEIIGTMNSLIRTKQGKFNIENSYTLEDIENDNYNIMNLEDILKLKKVEIDIENMKKVINGNELNLNYNGYVLFQYNNIDLALYNFKDKIGTLKILF